MACRAAAPGTPELPPQTWAAACIAAARNADGDATEEAAQEPLRNDRVETSDDVAEAAEEAVAAAVRSDLSVCPSRRNRADKRWV